ncbi:MAG: BrnT family toxin [Holophaga sp.]|jgi:hypothetical protein
MIRFEWDPLKAVANLKKHSVSFEEAQSTFYDEFAVQFFDDEHSTSEDRFLLLGLSSRARLLLVCHCEKESGNTIRIISARRATNRESAFYGGE